MNNCTNGFSLGVQTLLEFLVLLGKPNETLYCLVHFLIRDGHSVSVFGVSKTIPNILEMAKRLPSRIYPEVEMKVDSQKSTVHFKSQFQIVYKVPNIVAHQPINLLLRKSDPAELLIECMGHLFLYGNDSLKSNKHKMDKCSPLKLIVRVTLIGSKSFVTIFKQYIRQPVPFCTHL